MSVHTNEGIALPVPLRRDWIHCTLIQEEVALRPSHPGFRFAGLGLFWGADVLWPENQILLFKTSLFQLKKKPILFNSKDFQLKKKSILFN